ncbi:GNAT family N-acetyltransferase [Jeotgalibacillus aurantiacus]|uniref:GNAT family N-acetyltransferase n=1 Tax=Jeotgalibacillus aurantiacus TaxID=2763266 RepID=UPI001D0A71A7|nr:GNAT family N-acetyltransferase [Jeotgalibacillus aurantiacus]
MELIFYTEKETSLIEQYQLSEEQLNFTGAPQNSIKLAEEDDQRRCILLMDEGKLVSYFVLHEKDGAAPYSDNPKAILMRTFSTDVRYLGKGYGKAAIKLLPDFVRKHYPHVNEIVLAVNMGNLVAQSLYEKNGYIDHGRRKMGRKGEMKILSLMLGQKAGVR